ncbi:unnamed protein product [Musa acuminata subsp. malaccensis]|uniref:(wild Malaysian banana) hypothetical protein n=1 Tax=Musa acuminata subsp. malaccensis TaxID=214687 RepID=A0A8D7A2J4_MUSAM|nr:unnamed protein product [Musa acuminata subsp. malaccensis]
MSNKMWESLVEHAKTCVLSGKYYVYYSDDTRDIGAIFNNIYEFCGLIAGGQFYSAENLNDNQKVFADVLVKKAYDNWMHVIEYDGKALLNFTKKKKALSDSSNDHEESQVNLQASYHLVDVITIIQRKATLLRILIFALFSSGSTITAVYSGNEGVTYSSSPPNVASDTNMQYENACFTPQNEAIGSAQQSLITRNDSTSLALALPQQTSIGFQPSSHSMEHSGLNIYDDWSGQQDSRCMDDFFSEEEIRLRSHEMLENEDMQHLLRTFTMGGASVGLPEDGYGFPPYMPSPCPNFNFDDERNRSSGKAVVGWLKIKAAMRWGIFVRKKAAERRAAQLVELEE